MSKAKVNVGNTFTNKEGNPFKVIRKLNKTEASHYPATTTPYFECMFWNGYKVVAHSGNILSGKIKNRLAGAVCDVGYLGDATVSDYPREYALWVGVIKRVYNRPGYAQVKMALRWFNFSNFVEDLPYIKEYELWAAGEAVELDKDGLSPVGQKIYSKDTCQFITRAENLSLKKKVG